jgi:hypothetical protein
MSWDRSTEAHRSAGCDIDPFGRGGDRHAKTCPDKKYLAWVRRRPWKQLRDLDIVAMNEEEAWEYGVGWDDFHKDKGCAQSNDGWNHTGCAPRDRKDPGIVERWERLVGQCDARGCEWPTGADGWTHVEGCRFWQFESPDDARRRIATNVNHATEHCIPENALKVLRALATTGLGTEESHVPSIDVMASVPYLAQRTDLSEMQVRRALARLTNLGYIKPLEDIENIGLDFMRRNARKLRAQAVKPGRPANWYRIQPPPAAIPEPPEKLDYSRLDALLAAVG